MVPAPKPSEVCVWTVSFPYSSTSRITVVWRPLMIWVCTDLLRPPPLLLLLLELKLTKEPPPLWTHKHAPEVGGRGASATRRAESDRTGCRHVPKAEGGEGCSGVRGKLRHAAGRLRIAAECLRKAASLRKGAAVEGVLHEACGAQIKPTSASSRGRTGQELAAAVSWGRTTAKGAAAPEKLAKDFERVAERRMRPAVASVRVVRA